MDNQKFNLILEKLLERTKENKLEWKTTASRETFLVVLKDSSISVSSGFDFNVGIDGEAQPYSYYTFDFRNENGEIVDSVSITESNKKDKKFDKTEELFNLARSQSLKIDQTVDRILEQLAT